MLLVKILDDEMRIILDELSERLIARNWTPKIPGRWRVHWIVSEGL